MHLQLHTGTPKPQRPVRLARVLRDLSGTPGAWRQRRGSFLVLVVGTLALLAVVMLVYVSVGNQDEHTRAALKNALDHAYVGWNRKPVAFVSYGGTSGGVRAVEQLRQVAVELQMASIRDEVNIPFIGRAMDEQGEPRDELHRKRLDAVLTDLAWWTETLRAGRARG